MEAKAADLHGVQCSTGMWYAGEEGKGRGRGQNLGESISTRKQVREPSRKPKFLRAQLLSFFLKGFGGGREVPPSSHPTFLSIQEVNAPSP